MKKADLSNQAHSALALTAEILSNRYERLKVLHNDDVPFDFIESNSEYSRTNWMTRKKIKAIMGVTKFIRPILLDRTYKIIDGQLRYELAVELHSEGHLAEAVIPAIVIDVDGDQATLLRILSNRMGEFARWDFKGDETKPNRPQDIPEFVDSAPQLQKFLDSLGFWSEKILPDDFFAKTILDLEKKFEKPVYKTEIGLVKWAEMQRELIAKKQAEKDKSPLKAPGNYESIFNLAPKKQDFVKNYEIEAEVDDYIHRMRDLAGVITDNYDAKRKAELKPGQAWQSTRRAPKKVIEDKKAELEEKFADDFDETLGEALED